VKTSATDNTSAMILEKGCLFMFIPP